eukprot:1154579-Pelagomonas_calceolata.AAC.1
MDFTRSCQPPLLLCPLPCYCPRLLEPGQHHRGPWQLDAEVIRAQAGSALAWPSLGLRLSQPQPQPRPWPQPGSGLRSKVLEGQPRCEAHLARVALPRLSSPGRIAQAVKPRSPYQGCQAQVA